MIDFSTNAVRRRLAYSLAVFPLLLGSCSRPAAPSKSVLDGGTRATSVDRLKRDASMPSLAGLSLRGESASIDFHQQEQRTLVLVYSPECPYCRVNLHNWRPLALGTHLYRVMWVDISASTDTRYLRSAGIPVDANLMLMSRDSASRIGLSATPTTIVVKENGTIAFYREGFLAEANLDELRKTLAL